MIDEVAIALKWLPLIPLFSLNAVSSPDRRSMKFVLKARMNKLSSLMDAKTKQQIYSAHITCLLPDTVSPLAEKSRVQTS